jgi:uncharacterized ion transporter superfamily protein YfcC
VKLTLPHPIVLLGGAVLAAALLTWILPAGQYDRRDDPATGRRVVVAGTYHRVAPAPVGLFGAATAIPRGFAAAADVIAVVIFVGGAWVIVDRIGTLSAVIAALLRSAAGRRLWIVPVVAVFFATMGALENMEEEIIALIPALLVLGAGIGVDPIVVVAMSAGAAMVGAAFGPTNPFQAQIALKLAQLPPMSSVGLRSSMFIAGVAVWIAWTMRHASRGFRLQAAGFGLELPEPSAQLLGPQSESGDSGAQSPEPEAASLTTARHILVLAIAVAPMAAYVYGAARLDWGFNELSGAFVVGGIAAGLVGGLSLAKTVDLYLEGMQLLLPSALMVGVARSISLVLDDGHVVDTILSTLVGGLAHLPQFLAAVMMVPAQALIHVAVPSVSGQAVLTMPVVVPLADVLGLSREVAVLTYQTGAGLTELLTPTNGAIMAILLAAGVPFRSWLRFAVGGVALLALIGIASLAFVR